MYSRSHSTTDARLGWSDSIKKFKSQRYAKRIAPFRSISDNKETYLGTQNNTLTKATTMNANIIQKALLQMVKNQKSQKQAIVAAAAAAAEASIKNDQGHSDSSTPELSINEQEQSDEPSTPSLVSSVSSYNDSEHSLDMDRIIQELLDNDDTGSSCLDDDDQDIVEKAVLMMNSTRKSQTCPDLTIVTNNIDVQVREEEQRPLPPLPNKEESELTISSNSIELCSKTSILKKHATLKMTRAASKGQIHLKRAATWLNQKMLLASPQVQSLGLLVSKKYHSVTSFGGNAMLRLNSSSNLDNFPPVVSISAATSASDLSSMDEPEQQQQQVKKLGFSEELVYGTDADHFTYLR